MRKIKMDAPVWQPVPEKKEKPAITFQEQKWNAVPLNEKKNDASIREKAIKIQPNQWDSLPEMEQGMNGSTHESKIEVKPQGWDAISGIQSPVVIRQFEGVNQLNSFAIKESHATRNKNITTKKYPALAVRSGGAQVGAKLPGAIDGLGVRAGNELHAIAGGTWYVLKNGAWTSVKTGLTPGKKWSFVNFQGSFPTMCLLATNGTDSAYKYDGTTVSALLNTGYKTVTNDCVITQNWKHDGFEWVTDGNTTNNAAATYEYKDDTFNGTLTLKNVLGGNPLKPTDVGKLDDKKSTTVTAKANYYGPVIGPSLVGMDFVCSHDNRVYLADKSTIKFSSLRKAEDYATVDDSGALVVETADGRNITGMTAGSARLTVFKDRSVHELFGTNPSNYTMKTVTEATGSPSGRSIQVIDGMIYFLGTDGIYKYSGGNAPSSEFSMAVKEYVKSINRTFAYTSNSWVEGSRYYLAIPTGSNTSPDTVLEYDPLFDTWNVWSFPYSITTTGVVMDGVTYLGNSNGEVLKLDGSTADNSTPIAWEWVTKPFSFSSLAAKNRWYRVWVIATVPTGSSMNVYVSDQESGESWTLVNSVASDVNLLSKEILIPVNLVSFSNFIRLRMEGTGPVTIYEVSRQERVFPMGLS